MMEEKEEQLDEVIEPVQEEIYSNAVRAGKRTYFFDVRATRNEDYYVTITESKKKFNKSGRFFYEKHKIFLYKEDFEKFADALCDTIDFIKSSNIQMASRNVDEVNDDSAANPFTKIDFDDLDNR